MDDKLIQSLAQRESRIHHKQQMDKLASLENSVVSTMRQLVKFLDGKTTKTEVVNQLKSVSTPDIDKVVDALNKLDSNNAKNKLDLTPLKEELTKLGKKLDKLPTEFPELPEGIEEVTVKNQIDLEPLEKAIKGLKLEAPKVDVAAPNVQVDAPDLKPLQDSLLDVVKSIKAQKYPETDLTKVEKKLDEANKHLKKIVEKRVGGGGGGGSSPTVDTGVGVFAVPVANPDGTPLSLGSTSVDTAISDGVTVGDTSTDILAVNENRKSATIVNDSDETIYLKLGSGASLNSGIRINANGGSAKITEYTGIITAISTSGGKVVTVTEL